ncbi:MAG: PilZ domain-containing protein [Candidatus Omnitrophota bacterium]
MATFEYRKLLRASVMLKVTYKTFGEPHLEGSGYSRNVGTIGVNLILSDKIERNTDVEVKILLPDNDIPVIARGKVIWVHRCEYIPPSNKQYYVCGVQFDDMSETDAVKTSDFVHRLLKEKSAQELKKTVDKLEEENK